MLKTKERRMEFGGFKRACASVQGICEVCRKNEATMITSCRRNHGQKLKVCDECGIDFHSTEFIVATQSFPYQMFQQVGAC